MENIHFNATPHDSLVWIKLYVDDVFSEPIKKDIEGRFYILNTFQSETCGSYMFVLLFRGASYPEVVEDIQRARHRFSYIRERIYVKRHAYYLFSGCTKL